MVLVTSIRVPINATSRKMNNTPNLLAPIPSNSRARVKLAARPAVVAITTTQKNSLASVASSPCTAANQLPSQPPSRCASPTIAKVTPNSST